jgi:hypothetical protein
MSQLGKLATMASFMGKYGEQHFPDCMWQVIAFNCPPSIEFAYKVIQKALSKATIARIRIFSGKPDEELGKLMPKEVLERFIKKGEALGKLGS